MAMQSTTSNGERGARIRTLLVCILAQNLAMGLAFGSFGALLAANEAHFGISRAMAAGGMSLIMLAIGLVSPFAGKLLAVVPVRTAMIGGTLLSLIGYAGLAFTQNYTLALIMYVLIGTGISLVAILGPLTLAVRWFDEGRGKMLALINLPLILFISPYLVALLLPEMGRFNMLMAIAAMFALLLPLLFLIVERPASAPAAAPMATATVAADNTADAAQVSPMRSVPFWLLSLGIGIWSGVGSAFMVHMVPAGIERGLAPEVSAGMLSTYAGAGVLGTLIFGWIIDRVGPIPALMLGAMVQVACWLLILNVDVSLMFVVAAVLGVCTVPLVTLHGAAMGALFGSEVVSRATGQSYAVKLPFMFGFAPLVGALFDWTGGYALPFMVCAASIGVAAGLFFATLLYVRGPKQVAKPVVSG